MLARCSPASVGSRPVEALASESGVHVLVYSGADSVSHSVRPNQKVGRSWKFHVPAGAVVLRLVFGGSSGSVTVVGHVVARSGDARLEQDRRLVVADVLLAEGVERIGAGRPVALAERSPWSLGVRRRWPRSPGWPMQRASAAPTKTRGQRPGSFHDGMTSVLGRPWREPGSGGARAPSKPRLRRPARSGMAPAGSVGCDLFPIHLLRGRRTGPWTPGVRQGGGRSCRLGIIRLGFHQVYP